MSKIKYPKISVVMLNYNGLQYLKKTIPAILKLDYPNYEFILVDNGSTDGSIEFVKKHKKVKLVKSPRVREKNFACNYAIKRAKGEYVFLMDNDALITNSDLLFDLIERYKRKTGVIGLSFYDIGSTKSKSYGDYLGYYFIKSKKMLPLEKLKEYDNCQIGYPEGKALFIKKSRWVKVGGYDDYLKFGGDDNDLGIKSWLFGYENVLYSKHQQIHLGLPERQDNKKYALKFKEMFYAHLYTITKNYSFFNMILTIIGYSIFSFFKSIKQSFCRASLTPLFSFVQGYYLFLINLPAAVKKRKEVQSSRVVKKDIFLKIKPPRIK